MWLKALFSRKKHDNPPLYLYNTLGKSKQEFYLPPQAKTVRMYNCGPTVYDVQHIGNLSMFVFTDVLRRTLEYNGFAVKQVINITDVGHLTSDADEGEDKMTRGLAREGKEPTLENMRGLGERYTKIFLSDLQRLSIDTSKIIFPRASSYIPAQIAMIATMEEKGYAYRTSDGIYFDTSRAKEYGALGGINLSDENKGKRVAAKSKRNPADFALWKFSASAGGRSASGGKGMTGALPDRQDGGNIMGWDAPWGKGFPGWHLECSAMIRACLGERIDVHTGGIEHIAVHHNNEIVQSETVTGKKPLSRFWMHRAHIQFEGAKLAKSEGRVVYLSDVIARGYHPLALRYLFLGAHYRTSGNFSWEALKAAQTAYLKLRSFADSGIKDGVAPQANKKRIWERFNDDLDTPGALAAVWEMAKDDKLSPPDIKAGLIDADKVLGLNLGKEDKEADAAFEKMFGRRVDMDELPEDIRTSIGERDAARLAKNWELADSIRKKLAASGYALEDTAEKTIVFKK